MKKLVLFSTISLAALALNACGAAQPTKELKDARATYQEAAQGKAAELAADELLTAKQALDRAEAAFNDSPGSYQERRLAYVAQRMAQIAAANGGRLNAQKELEKADADYKAALEELNKAARDEAAKTAAELKANQERLDKIRKDMADQGNKLGEAAQKLKAQEAELEARQKELMTEKAARAEAEKKLAAAMKSLEEIAKIKEEQRGLVITLDGAVLFASGKTALLPIAQSKLDKVAEVLQQQSDDKKIVVEGHTDSMGSDADNLKLSQGRAEAVRSHLVSKGVKADRITAVGKGESTPIADNKSPEGRANNRRVEIVVSNK
jgi:outer membrane protein OmpA-like peptidoglycan-associated protein